jgi:hypothetical protein
MPKKPTIQKRDLRTRTQLFVVREGNQWAVKSAGSVRNGRAYPTQKAAIAAARAMIRSKEGGEVVTHDRNGRIKSVDTYVVGQAAAKMISAVEGIYLASAMTEDFRELDRLRLSPEKRRDWLMSKYGNNKRRGL